MRVPELPKTPVDGFTIEYWTFESVGSYAPGPKQHLLIYVKNMTWEAFIKDPRFKAFHTYAEGGDHAGAPFEDDWLHVNQRGDDGMRFEGRSEGWLSPVKGDSKEWERDYATRAEAIAAFLEDTEKFVERKQQDIRKAQLAIRQVTIQYLSKE